MPNVTVPAAARGLPSSPPLFLEITAEVRRALDLLAEAAVALLDEIDRPLEDLEPDADFELECEDEGAQCDDEGAADPDLEPCLGWGTDGSLGGIDADEDIVEPDTAGGFRLAEWRSPEEHAAAKGAFDPRLLTRTNPVRWTNRHTRRIPTFPHEALDRPAFVLAAELRRLRVRLAPKTRRPQLRPDPRSTRRPAK